MNHTKDSLVGCSRNTIKIQESEIFTFMPKRIGFIFEKVRDIENIKEAIIKSSKQKRNRPIVRRCLENLDTTARNIQTILDNGYIPSPYTEREINDGIVLKKRIICVPNYYPDQIIHWALMLQIEPILNRGMVKYNCGSVKNRGTIYAKNVVEGWIRTDPRNTKWYGKGDITKYYPNVNISILKRKITRIIKDDRVMDVINYILNSHPQGLPIGFYTSQCFANFYLQDFDHYMMEKSQGSYYIRYMDDFIVFSSNKRVLRRIHYQVIDFLKSHDLELKKNWQVSRVTDRPIDFCGYVMSRDRTRIRKSISRRIRRKSLRVQRENYTYPNCTALLSYLGWVKHINSQKFKEKYIDSLDITRMKEVTKDGQRRKNRTSGRVLYPDIREYSQRNSIS